MAKKIGRNRNTFDEAATSIVPINSLTATIISSANADRLHFQVILEPGIIDVDIFIRYYPAATDDLKQGTDVLTRRTMGNDTLFNPGHKMDPDSPYLGEISAILLSGVPHNIIVTEG